MTTEDWKRVLYYWTPFFLFIVILLRQCSDSTPQELQTIRIGTGDVNSVYHATGQAIANLMSEGPDRDRIKVVVPTRACSFFNIEGLIAGEYDLAIVQMDRYYHAVHGLSDWRGRPQDSLRFVCNLGPEMLTLIAGDSTHIQDLSDLKGKRVNIAPINSGTRNNANSVLFLRGLKKNRDFTGKEWHIENALIQFEEGGIDAFFYTISHPNDWMNKLERPFHFVPITGVEELVKRHPYYSHASIPIQYYPEASNKELVPTIATHTTLLSADDVDEELVYTVVRNLFENLEVLKNSHPSLAGLTPQKMLNNAFAPIHPGALRYYREAGLKE